ncbi:hypothetical protein [Microvirga massiliensis]|uniref:hypothetical protein n=1 Tax=Microvirga massiliensis TaxID=1033741 RepID=UPI00062B2EA4|nr:hypothetical protein [Microvirga massiliensis]
MQDQHSSILKEYATTAAAIGIRDMEFFKNRAAAPMGPGRGWIEPLDGASSDEAFAFIDENGKPQLWVTPFEPDKYRRWFDVFTRKYYGVEFSRIATGVPHNIDQLYPKAAGKEQEFRYVRATAIDPISNQNIGRTIEKQMKQRKVEIKKDPALLDSKKEPKPIRNATPFTLGKVTGFHESFKLPDDRSLPANRGVAERLIAHVEKYLRVKSPLVSQQLNIELTQLSATRIQTPISERPEKLGRVTSDFTKRWSK